MSKPKIIAFYLPQYHPTPDNDKWWGKGFTEWTNVGKAKSLFPGHYQPKVPADLGYYDLRLPEVREAQAELAKEAGIYGFCYYHYWFGNGKQELELPFNEVLRLGKPDFPFMLCWANESWHKKFWNKDGKGTSKEVLVEQTYPEGDIEKHFYHLLPAFRDTRYIKIDGKPAFMIYKPHYIPLYYDIINIWNRLATENGLRGIHFIAHIQSEKEQGCSEKLSIEKYTSEGYDAINVNRLFSYLESRKTFHKLWNRISRKLLHIPLIVNYQKVAKSFINEETDKNDNVYPTVIPNWDHTPRSGLNGLVYKNSTPDQFKAHLKLALNCKEGQNFTSYIFLKSWNEWGEGNYIEPDLKYGKEYIKKIREALNEGN